MILKATGDNIFFGTDDHIHQLSTKRLDHFEAADVETARADLLAAFPDESADINRYADRLMDMLP